MNALRLSLALGLLAMALLVTGCQEGGRFLSQLDTHINDEGQLGPELASSVRRFFQSEAEKPGFLRKDWQSAYTNNEVHRESIGNDVRNFLRREREILPYIDLESQSLGQGVKVARQRHAFPGEGE